MKIGFPKRENRETRGEPFIKDIIQNYFPRQRNMQLWSGRATKRPHEDWKQARTKAHRYDISER